MAVINVHVHPGMNTKMEVVKVSTQWDYVVTKYYGHYNMITVFYDLRLNCQVYTSQVDTS